MGDRRITNIIIIMSKSNSVLHSASGSDHKVLMTTVVFYATKVYMQYSNHCSVQSRIQNEPHSEAGMRPCDRKLPAMNDLRCMHLMPIG